MKLSDHLASWFRPVAYFSRNPLSLAGAVLTTASAVTLIAYWTFEILIGGGAGAYPYAGILFFLILPSLFAIGLILVLVGGLWRRRQLLRRGELPAEYPRFDLADPLLRKGLAMVGIATGLNIIIFTAAAYQGTKYMDSVKFCGLTCHNVMQPEYTAYLNSPHSRVACVQCHIGPGASWFVRAKLSGVKQVFAVMLDNYPRPITTPIQHLRPARATCEQCHWPERFLGNPILLINHYASDKNNTSSTTVLVMKIGGENGNKLEGIHGHHVGRGVRISYIALDQKLQKIAQVTYTTPSGKTTVFNSTEIKATPEQLAQGQHRVMDCMDCHNRPTHTFQLPGDALDEAMSQGLISTSLPFMKKEALQALKTNYPDRATAKRRIAKTLRNYYKTNYPNVISSQGAQLNSSIHEVQEIYLRNVFPKMKVTWGTYINNLGHMHWPGCFRCHDGSHVSKDGQTIPNDCDTCHHILAIDQHNPKILSELGMN